MDNGAPARNEPFIPATYQEIRIAPFFRYVLSFPDVLSVEDADILPRLFSVHSLVADFIKQVSSFFFSFSFSSSMPSLTIFGAFVDPHLTAVK